MRKLSTLVVLCLSGCGLFAGSDSEEGTGDPCIDEPLVSVTITPATATMKPGQRLTFSWDFRSKRGLATAHAEVTGGSIEPAGQATVWWTAPPVPGQYELHVVHDGCPSQFGTATLTVEPIPDPGPAPGQQPAATGVAWSPDGTKLAVAARGGIWIFGSDGAFVDSMKLPHQGPVSVDWSPDGTLIAASGDVGNAPWLIDADTLTPYGIPSKATKGGVRFSEDSSELFVHEGDRVTGTKLSDGAQRVVANPRPFTLQAGQVPWIDLGPLGGVLMSPGELRERTTGRKIASWADGAALDFAVMARDGSWVLTNAGVRHPFFPEIATAGGVTSGGAAALAHLEDDLVVLGVGSSLHALRVRFGQPTQEVGSFTLFSGGTIVSVAWSPDDSRVAVAAGNRHVIVTRAQLGL